jgi:hypothetical protein
MNTLGARQVMETTSYETANQYIRFGWKLVNQHVVEATDEQPARMNYVLASLQTLQDTRRLTTLHDTPSVNAHLERGWKLIDQYVTSAKGRARQQTIHFVLAWQSEDPPVFPSADPIEPDSEAAPQADATPDAPV